VTAGAAPAGRRPELLAPAGTLRNLRYALAYGADAVYAGVPRYSLRVRNNDFDLANLATGIAETQALGRRFYLAANALPHGAKLKTFLDDMAPVVALGPDAPLCLLVGGDAFNGFLEWHRPRDILTLAHIAVMRRPGSWQQQGVTRVILSRELSLEEIHEIRSACPDMELEVFVHGALCIAYSGRCLLSGYFNHRDANQGTCTNACRWEYRLAAPTAAGDEAPAPAPIAAQDLLQAEPAAPDARHPAADEIWLLEEARRPGEYMPVFEDEQGTYILNAKDLRAVQLVAALVAMGIDCLKIEGRTKSHYYAARTTRVYREAIDDAVAGRPFRTELLDELDGLANRGYTEGFYRRHAPAAMQNYADGASRNHKRVFVGEVLGPDAATGLVRVAVRNKTTLRDDLELLTPQGSLWPRIERMLGPDGAARDVAPGDGWEVRLPLPWPEARYGLLTAAV